MSLTRTLSLLAVLLAAGLGLAWYTASDGPWRTRHALTADGIDTSRNLTHIVVTSSIDQRKPAPGWRSLLEEKPDLVLLLGDIVYGGETRNDPDMKELAAAYELLGRDTGFQALRKAAPMLSIWDDHDFGPDDSGSDFPYKARSKALFVDFWRIPSGSPRGRREGLYESVIFGPAGQRVQVLLLDARWFRDPLKPTDAPGVAGKERYVADLDPKHTLLGAQQWAWLEGELKKPAELRLIVSPIQVIAEGHGYEKWSNFPNERQRLFDLIQSTHAKGVVFLSANRHLGAIYRRVEGAPYPLFEMTAGSLNDAIAPSRDEVDPTRLGPLVAQANYGTVSIDWQRQSVTLEVKGLDGKPVRLASVALAVLYPQDTGNQSVFWSGQPEPLPPPESVAADPAPPMPAQEVAPISDHDAAPTAGADLAPLRVPAPPDSGAAVSPATGALVGARDTP